MAEMRIQNLVLGMVATNCYFLLNADTKEMILVDPADEAEAIEEKVNAMGGRPVAVLLTHGHYDHMLAADSVRRTYQIPVYVHELDEAVLEVQQALKDGADEDDARLNWLAAAVAFLRYTEITAARDRAACTFAGTIAQNTDAAQKLEFAGLLVQAYRRLCRSLLEDETFLFQTV